MPENIEATPVELPDQPHQRDRATSSDDSHPPSTPNTADGSPITIRPFTAADGVPTLNIFLDAIRNTAAADYTPEQIAAWIPAGADPDVWLERRSQLNTVVAVVDDQVAGFSDVSASGFIAMLFVDPAFGRRGIATALLQWAHAEAKRLGSSTLSTRASITARPLFEAHGFVVDAKRHPIVDGVVMENYAMSRRI